MATVGLSYIITCPNPNCPAYHKGFSSHQGLKSNPLSFFQTCDKCNSPCYIVSLSFESVSVVKIKSKHREEMNSTTKAITPSNYLSQKPLKYNISDYQLMEIEAQRVGKKSFSFTLSTPASEEVVVEEIEAQRVGKEVVVEEKNTSREVEINGMALKITFLFLFVLTLETLINNYWINFVVIVCFVVIGHIYIVNIGIVDKRDSKMPFTKKETIVPQKGRKVEAILLDPMNNKTAKVIVPPSVPVPIEFGLVNKDHQSATILASSAVPTKSKLLSSFYTLEPHNLEISEPVEIFIPFDPKVPAERVVICHMKYDKKSRPCSSWTPLKGTKIVGPGIAAVMVDRFSGFAAFDVSSQEIFDVVSTNNNFEALFPGFLVRGRCKNNKCFQYGQFVNAHLGYGKFDMSIHRELDLEDDTEAVNLNEVRCPECNQEFEGQMGIIHDAVVTVVYASNQTKKRHKIDLEVEDNTAEVLGSQDGMIDVDVQLKNYRLLIVDCKPRPNVVVQIDVCFMLDITGSMSNILEEAQKVIINVADTLATNLRTILHVENCSARMGFLGYRDYTLNDKGRPDEVRFDTQDFTENIPQIVEHIKTIHASGGVDEAEDVLGALQQTLNMNWQSNMKILFMIGDSPCHGRQYNGGCEDFDPDMHGPNNEGCPTPENLLARAAGMGIHIIYCEIPHMDGRITTKQMSGAFKHIYESYGRRWTEEQLSINGNAFEQVITTATMKKLGELIGKKTRPFL